MNKVRIVLPVYRNQGTLAPLVEALRAAVTPHGMTPFFVVVDDACPERSTAALEALQCEDVMILRHDVNRGQQQAIKHGLAVCKEYPVVVMDADFQDPPEAVPALLQALQTGPFDAVFATRVGRYQSIFRDISGRIFRFVIRKLVALPVGAGGFVALTPDLVDRLNSSRNDRFYLAGLVGYHADQIGAVPVARFRRRIGQSAYSGIMRWQLGFSNILCLLNERRTHARKHI